MFKEKTEKFYLFLQEKEDGDTKLKYVFWGKKSMGTRLKIDSYTLSNPYIFLLKLI